MIRREQLLAEEMMDMGPMDKLADMCPKCYGPQVLGKRIEEPDFIVCMDGNFQHRRHLAASAETQEPIKTPSIFIEPHKVSQMEESMDYLGHDHPVYLTSIYYNRLPNMYWLAVINLQTGGPMYPTAHCSRRY